MAEFSEITLHRIEPQVTINAPENRITFAGVSKTVKEWERWVERVNRALRRYKLLSPDKTNRGIPVTDGTRFLYHNLSTINKIKRGKIKKAPWYLKNVDYIITNEELIDNDTV